MERSCEWEPFEDRFKCKHCGFEISTDRARRNCVKLPGLTKRAINLTKAGVRHLAKGLKHCTEEQQQARYKQCQKNECGFFKEHKEGGICAHSSCGCFLRSHGFFMDKLSWAESECPEGYWGPVD